MRKEAKPFVRECEKCFIYRDESNQFNLSFRIRNLEVKLLIGNYLSHTRVELARLTQKDVAKKAGISIRNLTYIETGYGASMDGILRVYLFYVSTGVLPVEKQELFFDLCRKIWMRE